MEKIEMLFRNNFSKQWKNDITKVIKSLENRGILIKGTTKEFTSQEKSFLNFLRPLMTAGFPLMKIVLTLLAKSVLIPLGLSIRMSAAVQLSKRTFMDLVWQY